MTIKYRLVNFDFDNDYLSFQIYGPDTADGTVRLAIVETAISEYATPQDWLDANPIEAQNLIDAGQGDTIFTIRQEVRNFIDNNPNAKQLITLGPNALELAITNRTANQETLLLKTLSFAIRVLYAENRGD